LAKPELPPDAFPPLILICKTPIRTELDAAFAPLHRGTRHVLLTADYSQIELRLLAHSRAIRFCRAYRRGDDIHTLTASQVFGVRRSWSRLTTAAGQSRQLRHRLWSLRLGLSQNLGIEPAEAKQFIAAYFEKYAGVRAFIRQDARRARREPESQNPFRRVRPIPDINSKNFTPERLCRAHSGKHSSARHRRPT